MALSVVTRPVTSPVYVYLDGEEHFVKLVRHLDDLKKCQIHVLVEHRSISGGQRCCGRVLASFIESPGVESCDDQVLSFEILPHRRREY